MCSATRYSLLWRSRRHWLLATRCPLPGSWPTSSFHTM